jgi:MoaA/NifB/PqqE/SkfB family radical SAM enzyme
VDDMRLSEPRQADLHGLEFLWLEITTKCNLECQHCYSNSGPRQALVGYMTPDDWLTVIRDSSNLGCRQIQFIGGEPTLHPDLPRFIYFASDNDYSFIEVFTNGTAISNRLLDVFIEKRVNVAVSFYSDDPSTHDSITQQKGSFDRTVVSLRRMVSAGLSIRAGIIEMKQNTGHVPRAKRFLENLGVTQISTDFQRRVGRASTSADPLDPMADLCGECWKRKMCVTSSRRIYPCVFCRFVDVGVVDLGIPAILAGESLGNLRLNIKNYMSKRTQYLSSSPSCPPICNPTCSPQPDFCMPRSLKCVPRETPRPCAPERL